MNSTTAAAGVTTVAAVSSPKPPGEYPYSAQVYRIPSHLCFHGGTWLVSFATYPLLLIRAEQFDEQVVTCMENVTNALFKGGTSYIRLVVWQRWNEYSRVAF